MGGGDGANTLEQVLYPHAKALDMQTHAKALAGSLRLILRTILEGRDLERKTPVHKISKTQAGDIAHTSTCLPSVKS